MEKRFIAFVYKYSLKQQIVIITLTAVTFPILYMTLDLPKQIINDAIGGDRFPYTVMGFDFEQLEYLLVLCLAYLATILTGGVIKMLTNTYKGIVGERLLRRLRYQLVSRIVRFPFSHFANTSEGSLISMVTAETEALGELMAEAFARPLFAAGQMMTILTFLFVQSIWLGLTAMAMIPFQALIVPRLQRSINQLNKTRILKIRTLSAFIGETIVGADELRSNGGVPYTLARFSKYFGDIFNVRLKIYQRKFLLKFLNNTLNQIAPFSLLLVGGYLTINGQLTVGALAAAFASYKELLGPWRELLSYYSQIQDSSLRYRTIVEQFEPPGMIETELLLDEPKVLPHLRGDFVLKNATIADQFGAPILSHMNAEFPFGSMIAIRSQSASGRQALARVLSGSVPPFSGNITIGGRDIASIHQGTFSARIGVVPANPKVFNSTIEHNVQMAFMRHPNPDAYLPRERQDFVNEAKRVGNCADPVDVSWYDFSIAGVSSRKQLRSWWFHIIHKLGFESTVMRRALNSYLQTSRHRELAERIVELRRTVRTRLDEQNIDGAVHRFDFERFNPSLTVLENALFAVRRTNVQMPGGRIDPNVRDLIHRIGLAEFYERWSFDILEAIVQTFSGVDSDHPVFWQLTDLAPETLQQLIQIHRKHREGGEISDPQKALVLTLPLNITADQLGSAFSKELQDLVVDIRKNFSSVLQDDILKYYEPIDVNEFNYSLTIIENLIFGKFDFNVYSKIELINSFVADELLNNDIYIDIMHLTEEVEVGYLGAGLDQGAVERIALVRAIIKRPDILILDKPLSNASPEIRNSFWRNIREILPESTIITLIDEIPENQQFDQVYEVSNGTLIDTRFAVAAAAPAPQTIETAKGNLSQKLVILSHVALFAQLDREQLRLLAFGAKWIRAKKGEYLYRAGEMPDGAYLLTEGTAELRRPFAARSEEPITRVEPGRLIGELAVIMNAPREFDLEATTDIVGLRIESQVLNGVINHDARVASNLLRTVTRYLLAESERLEKAKMELAARRQTPDA